MNEYYSSGQPELSPRSREMKDIDKSKEVGIEEWGTTTNPFEHQTNALKARIFHGANRVEFAFFGQQKGRKEQPTPESFGKRERQDMRELAEFNKVQTTTHATVGVSGLSGFNPQQNSFDERTRKEGIDEIKRAIHFAAEATTGGAVVFHTGEAFRSMISRWQDKDGKPLFKMFPEEEEREMHFLADPVTRRIIGPIRENDRVAVPKIKYGKDGKPEYIKDENGNIVEDELLKEYDKVNKGRIPIYEFDEKGNIQTEMIDFKEWKKRRIKEWEEKVGRRPNEEEIVKDFFQFQQLLQVQYNLYFGIGHEQQYKKGLEDRERIIKALNYYKKLKKKVPKEDWWQFEKKAELDRWGLIPPKNVDPVKWLQEQLWDIDRNLSYTRELAVQGRRTARETLDTVKRSQLAHDYAVKESAKSIAEIGEYAWRMTEKAHKNYKDGKVNYDIKNPIYVAPENLFPETYGSHPDELKKLVIEGRKAMVKRLKSNYGMKEKEAEKLAKQHIKATFDIGHANIWRKYFVSKPGESLEQRDKRFNKWLLKKTKDLLKEGIIGHIHVSDNFGFHDEHLTAGDGNSPIKEFIAQAKKEGFDEFIVESGSFNPMTSLPDTWMHFDSPVYSIHIPGITPDRWTDPSSAPQHGWSNFYRSYFGRTEGPRYIVGDYAPSEDFKGAPFYTGVGLE